MWRVGLVSRWPGSGWEPLYVANRKGGTAIGGHQLSVRMGRSRGFLFLNTLCAPEQNKTSFPFQFEKTIDVANNHHRLPLFLLPHFLSISFSPLLLLLLSLFLFSLSSKSFFILYPNHSFLASSLLSSHSYLYYPFLSFLNLLFSFLIIFHLLSILPDS